jgi:hypothetical protein
MSTKKIKYTSSSDDNTDEKIKKNINKSILSNSSSDDSESDNDELKQLKNIEQNLDSKINNYKQFNTIYPMQGIHRDYETKKWRAKVYDLKINKLNYVKK